MNDNKSILLVYANQAPSPKYPTLKKSQESKKDIAFRLNFSSTKNQERNINHVMGTFEKPFTTLGVNSELKQQFNQIIIDLKQTFKKIDKDHSNKELNQKFWEQWNQFDTILHQMSVHSAYYYCSREIERLTLDITGAIKSIKSNPPAVPGIQHEFSVTVEKIQKSFVQIVDRFAEIVDSKIDESKKIRDLESMRNQIRQFRTDIVGDRSKFFSLSSANHSTQEKAKQTIENSLNTIIATISDLKRQTYLLDNLDNEITQAMRVIEMMIDGDPLPNAKSERIQEKVTIEKENLVENRSVSSPTKIKSNISRRCTISSSNKDNKNGKRRSSRRRKSIKRNQSLIELEKSNSENESETSFVSSLSEFQDGKELLFDSSPINADLSDIDEDTMFQISDDDENSEENDEDKEYDLPFECSQPRNISFEEENDNEIRKKENDDQINKEKTNQLSESSDSNDSVKSTSIEDKDNDDQHEEEVHETENLDDNNKDEIKNNDDTKVEDNEIEDTVQLPTNIDVIDKSTEKVDNEDEKVEIIEKVESNSLNLSDEKNEDKQNDECNNDIEIQNPNVEQQDEDNKSKKITSNKRNRKSLLPNSLLQTSDDSNAEEFLSSDLEEINIPLVCSCPLLTFDLGSSISPLSTSKSVSFEKVGVTNTTINHTIIVKKRSGSESCFMPFLLICFMMITFLLLLALHFQ